MERLGPVARAALLALLSCCGGSSQAEPAADAGAAASSSDASADAASPTFCTTSNADFCADFDRGATPGADFDGVGVAGGGSLELIDAVASSRPKALRSTLPALAAAAPPASAQVEKRLSLPPGKRVITIDVAARFGGPAGAGNPLVRVIALGLGTGSIGLFRNGETWFVAVHRDNAGADEDEEPALASGPPLDTWSKLRLEVVLGRPGNIRIEIDGQEKLSRSIATHGDAQPLADAALVLGLSRVSGELAGMSADFDDATVRLAAP